jgi:anti-anti-sigma factor
MRRRDGRTNAAAVKKQQGIVIVMPQSRMDIFVAPLLVKQFNQLLDEGNTRLVVDLSDVRVVEGDGDYPLLHLLKRSHDLDAQVVLVCPQGNPVRILYELTQFDQLFDMVETLDAALGRFEA